MRVGLDLDGTLVTYDRILFQEAREHLEMPTDVLPRKQAVRDWIRSRDDGESRWIELQGRVYGPLMALARPAPGVLDFLSGCREAGIAVSIVSHRTPRAVAPPHFDLHAAAFEWLLRHGVCNGRFGVRRQDVHLEQTRHAKLARIGSIRCAIFVDDLEELLGEPAFPPSVERWLYAPDAAADDGRDVQVFSDWNEILRRALEVQEEIRWSTTGRSL